MGWRRVPALRAPTTDSQSHSKCMSRCTTCRDTSKNALVRKRTLTVYSLTFATHTKRLLIVFSAVERLAARRVKRRNMSVCLMCSRAVFVLVRRVPIPSGSFCRRSCRFASSQMCGLLRISCERFETFQQHALASEVFRDFEHWIVTCSLACFDVSPFPRETSDGCVSWPGVAEITMNAAAKQTMGTLEVKSARCSCRDSQLQCSELCVRGFLPDACRHEGSC